MFEASARQTPLRNVKPAWRRCAITIHIVCAALLMLAAANPVAAEPSRNSTPSSYARVFRLAEKGNMNAEAQLASMYLAGRGVPQDFYQAAVWYYLAAVQGHREAQFQLGLLYNKGQGVVRDYVLSYLWLNLSAAHAFGEDRDYKMRVRDAVAQKMLPAELAHAQEMSVVFYKTH